MSTARTDKTAPALEMRAISKTFPGVRALSDVAITVHFGTIHAVVGENGAGKSTLMKILSGIYAPTQGSIGLEGQTFDRLHPADAQKLGIRMVHQELNLAPDLSVAENIHLGRMPTRGLFLDRRTMRKQTQQVLDTLGVRLNPDVLVGDLSVSQQQLVEIARAYAAEPTIIVLDEPTSSLSEHEAQNLFEVLRSMRKSGIAVLYISHRLREVLDIADEVTVLRDGALVKTCPVEGLTAADMIRLMVGREVDDLFPKVNVPIGERVLEVEGISDGDLVHDASLHVHAGEIVGLTGLVGSGRTELAHALFGLAPRTAGRLRVMGKPVDPRNPAEAMQIGLAYVPEDRKRDGIIPAMRVRENISLPTLRNLASLGFTRRTKERDLAHASTKQLGISPADPERRIMNLSGGNQQKAVLAKWIASKPAVLILDEPTRGVDVGAKADIHRIIGELVADGLGVLMISSELPEVMAVSDRVYVMHEGAVAGELDRSELTEESIMALATGEGDALPSKTPTSPVPAEGAAA